MTIREFVANKNDDVKIHMEDQNGNQMKSNVDFIKIYSRLWLDAEILDYKKNSKGVIEIKVIR